jgi:uncharacterized protein YecT (DUF1311 family)
MRNVLVVALMIMFLGTDARGESPCDSPRKPDLMACAEGQKREAEIALDRYMKEVRRLLQDSPEALSALSKAQRAWEAYVQADCLAVYSYGGVGERDIQATFCKAHYTQERVYALWDRYLRTSTSDLAAPLSRCHDSEGSNDGPPPM